MTKAARPEPNRAGRARRGGRRGYVLLVTLVLLALVSLSLAGITRLSLARAAEARSAAREAQLRWGNLSLRRAVLPDAEELLAAAEARNGGGKADSPAVTVRLDATLGGVPFRLFVSDEQAKANVNVLLGDRSSPLARGDAERTLRRMLGGSPAAGGSVRLRPAGDGRDGVGEYVGSLSQIFDGFDPAGFLPSDGPAAGGFGEAAHGLVTCWGDGRLNVWRASAEALRAAAVPPLTAAQARKLDAARGEVLEEWRRAVAKYEEHERRRPNGGGRSAPPRRPTQDAVLARLDLSGRQREAAARLMRDGSACHSLWVVAGDAAPARYTLAVREDGTGGDEPPVVRVFEW